MNSFETLGYIREFESFLGHPDEDAEITVACQPSEPRMVIGTIKFDSTTREIEILTHLHNF